MNLKLVSWNDYSDRSGMIVARRTIIKSRFELEELIEADSAIVANYARRKNFKVGFVIDSMRFSDNGIPKPLLLTKEYAGQKHYFKFIAGSETHLVDRLTMTGCTIFTGGTFA